MEYLASSNPVHKLQDGVFLCERPVQGPGEGVNHMRLLKGDEGGCSIGLIVFVATCIVGIAQLAWADLPTKPPTDGSYFVTELRDGRVVVSVDIERVGDELVFHIRDGSKIRFEAEDVVTGSTRFVDFGNPWPEHRKRTNPRPNLTRLAARTELPVSHIRIEGEAEDEGLGSGASLSVWEIERRKVMQTVSEVTVAYGGLAKETDRAIQEYLGGCYGCVETYHESHTWGSSESVGVGATQFSGVYVQGYPTGPLQMGMFWGDATSVWTETQTWHESKETVSCTPRRELPHCVSLESLIRNNVSVIGPLLVPALLTARSIGIPDEEIDDILVRRGFPEMSIWID